MPDLSDVLFGLHDAVCSVIFSNKPLTLSMNMCIYTNYVNSMPPPTPTPQNYALFCVVSINPQ